MKIQARITSADASKIMLANVLPGQSFCFIGYEDTFLKSDDCPPIYMCFNDPEIQSLDGKQLVIDRSNGLVRAIDPSYKVILLTSSAGDWGSTIRKKLSDCVPGDGFLDDEDGAWIVGNCPSRVRDESGLSNEVYAVKSDGTVARTFFSGYMVRVFKNPVFAIYFSL